jgi:hypothetical protein
MNKKNILLIASIFAIFLLAIGVFWATDGPSYGEVMELLQNSNSTDLEGCCSIACQLDGNNSIMSFRRDSPAAADIYIEQVNWHGKPAIKQYKTDGKYFCQVIVTNDGWTIGFGGLDDGEDNKIVENITADMVLKNNISEDGLSQIEDIKHSYNRGHALIKAPDGHYGVVINDTHFTGDLKPGEYISVPNKYSFYRSGNIEMNSSDKIKDMNYLEITDGYGLERRDITTYYFHNVTNDTFKGNVTDIFLSNDAGTIYGMNTGGLADNVIFNNTTIEGSSIPVAPKYDTLGSVDYPAPDDGGILASIFGIILYIFVIVLVIIIAVLIIRTINKIRYARRRR